MGMLLSVFLPTRSADHGVVARPVVLATWDIRSKKMAKSNVANLASYVDKEEKI
jgi:hypothetical protein